MARLLVNSIVLTTKIPKWTSEGTEQVTPLQFLQHNQLKLLAESAGHLYEGRTSIYLKGINTMFTIMIARPRVLLRKRRRNSQMALFM